MLDKFKLSTRILVLGVTLVVAFSAIFGWLYPKIRGNMYDAKYVKTRHLVETAYSVVAHYADQSAKGLMTPAQAQDSRRSKPWRPCAMKAMTTSGSTIWRPAWSCTP